MHAHPCPVSSDARPDVGPGFDDPGVELSFPVLILSIAAVLGRTETFTGVG
jgi:hypothetical protein